MNAIYRNLNECIDNVINLGGFEDSFISHVPRDFIIDRVRRGYRDWVVQGLTAEVKALRINVSDDNTIILPDDYIKYFRLSMINKWGRMVPIGVDDSLVISNSYLLDNDAEILVDDGGFPLLGSGDDDIDRSKQTYFFDYSQSYEGHYPHYYASWTEFQNINPSFYKTVRFKEDIVKGLIQLQGEVLETVVLEYAYNPLKNTNNLDSLEISEQFATALEKWAYQDLIGPMRSVPPGEKRRAERDFEKTMLEAKISALAPALNDIVQAVHML